MTIGEKTYKLGYMSALGGKKRCISLTESTIVELSKTTPPTKMGDCVHKHDRGKNTDALHIT